MARSQKGSATRQEAHTPPIEYADEVDHRPLRERGYGFEERGRCTCLSRWVGIDGINLVDRDPGPPEF
jgi:hypothetical protein